MDCQKIKNLLQVAQECLSGDSQGLEIARQEALQEARTLQSVQWDGIVQAIQNGSQWQVF
jgi:hypothetical protein